MLILEDLKKSYDGIRAVNDVSFKVEKGDIYGFLGPNGAGKTTTIRMIMGIIHPDSGRIELNGDDINSLNRQHLGYLPEDRGLYQKQKLEETLQYFGLLRGLDNEQARAKALKWLERFDLGEQGNRKIEELSKGNQQKIQFILSLLHDPDLIIMDEPTSSLTHHETKRLFSLIRELKGQDVCIVYISHRLMEVNEIADRVIVLRDGQNSGELQKDEIEHSRMVALMVGRDSTDFYQPQARQTGAVRLQVENLVVPGLSSQPISLSLRAGDVVGMAGLVGAGRTELAESIFGIRQPISGSVSVDDQQIRIDSPKDAIQAGVFLVPEDRRLHGLIAAFTVCYNIALPGLDRYQMGGFIQRKTIEDVTEKMVEELSIKTTSIDQELGLLSGGNQQKVAMGKWFSLKPKVLLLDEPTRGVDVMSKSEIYQLIDQMAEMGIAILAISSDLEEVLRISDRVLVMHKGRLAGQLNRDQLTEETIMHLATGTV